MSQDRGLWLDAAPPAKRKGLCTRKNAADGQLVPPGGWEGGRRVSFLKKKKKEKLF